MLKHENLTGQIIKAFYKVYNTLGYGFLEKVYENALAIKLSKNNLTVIQQAPMAVYYEGHAVGNYFADILVQDLVILEIKAATSLVADHGTQLINYLKASKSEVGLVLNFGPKPEFQRKVFDHKLGQDVIDEP